MANGSISHDRFVSVPQHFLQSTFRREVPAHPMHAGAGRRRRRADVQSANRCRIKLARRTREELPDVARAGSDVASHEIRVVMLDVGGPHDAPRDHALAKTWREAFDL